MPIFARRQPVSAHKGSCKKAIVNAIYYLICSHRKDPWSIIASVPCEKVEHKPESETWQTRF